MPETESATPRYVYERCNGDVYDSARFSENIYGSARFSENIYERKQHPPGRGAPRRGAPKARRVVFSHYNLPDAVRK